MAVRTEGWLIALAACLAGAATSPVSSHPTDRPSIAVQSSPQATSIVFAAGPKDHGAPGRHEYAKDLAASNVGSVTSTVYTDHVLDASELANAAVLVMESSGDRTPTEHHVLFPQDATTDHRGYDAATAERLQRIDDLAHKGLGIVVLHYATYVNNATARRYFTDWVGAYYESGYSRTVVADWNVAPATTSHPILRGVAPWMTHEEFYINYRIPADPRLTPLLTATPTTPTAMPPVPAATAPLAGPPPVDPPNVPASLVSWAVERAGGAQRDHLGCAPRGAGPRSPVRAAAGMREVRS